MKQNKLTSLQTVKLFQFLDERKETIRNFSGETLAAEATGALGFKVVPSNVSSMRRDMGFGPRRVVKQAKLDTLAVIAKELSTMLTFSSVRPSDEFTALLKSMGL